MVVKGLAVPYNVLSDDWDIMLPGAFDKVLGQCSKLPLLFEHNESIVLGETLGFESTCEGLYHVSKIHDTPSGRDAIKLIEKGVVDSFSVGYYFNAKKYPREGSFREIGEVLIFEELSLVFMPAYHSAVMSGKQSKKSETNGDRLQRLDPFWYVRYENEKIREILVEKYRQFNRMDSDKTVYNKL